MSQPSKRRKTAEDAYKIVNDPIHGHFEIHPLCVKIIDTPQFQRLRYLKQLGANYYVYPGASHNRFEHSLGVYYLAGELATTLKTRQPELEIEDKDILCVQIAGLCHDLGHGPFSHMFDRMFLPKARPGEKIEHEDLSVEMFDHLVKSNNLYPEFQEHELTETDVLFIKEQIRGPLQRQSEEWPYGGRNKEKGFLYEIVANKRNGIDVDKWDYFARDCHMLGVKSNFDHTRSMKYARVLFVNGEFQICSRDKEAVNLYNMFHTRKTLHIIAYQHSVGHAIEIMITEAMLKADEFITFTGKDKEQPLKISETVNDMEAHEKLTDYIFHQILLSKEDCLKDSRELLMRIQKRELYKCVGQALLPKNRMTTHKAVVDNFLQILRDIASPLQGEDIEIHLVFLNYGMKEDNPIDHVRFYNKKNQKVPIEVRKNQVSNMLPETFAEQLIGFYCKKLDDESIKQTTLAYKRWSDQNECSVVGDDLMPGMTPVKPQPKASSSEASTQEKVDTSQRNLSFD